jgi:hypothetical protein
VSSETAAAGALLAGRYRLERQVASHGSVTLWRGRDEILNRAIAVKLLTTDEDSESFLSAAVAAGRLGHPRIASTYDAAEEDGQAYVVSEWVESSPLAELLQDGPLSPARATTVVAQVAEALAHAHDREVPHLDLDASNVLVCSDGSVKVTDFALGRAVAPAGTPLGEPARVDTEALGALLYAALTARSVTGADPGLALAPRRNGVLASPRQVRAGIPRELDVVVQRILTPERVKGAPIRTPSEVVRALAPLPGDSGSVRTTAPVPVREDAPDRPWRRRLLRVGLPLVVVLALGGAGLALGYVVGELPPPETPFPQITVSSAPNAPAPVAIRPVGGRDYDPEGDGSENKGAVPLAFDGDGSTAWETSRYRSSATFSGLKPGVGIVLDLGSPTPVGRVTVAFPVEGVSLELRAADAIGDDVSAVPVVASVVDAKRTTTLTPQGGVRARYWLLWITRLVEAPEGGFRAGISEVTFQR